MRIVYLDGANNSGVLLFVMAPDDSGRRAMLICPRKVEGGKLVPSNFVMTDAHFMPFGRGYGQLAGDTGTSRVLARVRVSQNIERVCQDEQDQSVSRVAFAEVGCGTKLLPRFEFLPEPVEASTERGKVIGGVQVGVEMEAPSGRMRVGSREVTFGVEPFKIPYETAMVSQNKKVKLQPGPCYLAVRQVSAYEEIMSPNAAN
jgi:hypothetical protein